MKRFARPVFICAISLFLWSSACGTLTGSSPTPVGTILTVSQTVPPSSTLPATATATSTTITPLIPITGENAVSLQCQFCVDDATYAVLVFPEFAFFDVASTSPVSCYTANVVNGQRILICRGTQQTSFNLNICSDNSNCLQFPIALQECLLSQPAVPVLTSTPATPVFLTAIGTFQPTDDDTPNDTPQRTPTPPSGTATPTPPPSTSTTQPPPSEEPEPTTEPTEEPEPTLEPTDPPSPTEEETSAPTEPGNEQGPLTRKPSNTSQPTNDNRP